MKKYYLLLFLFMLMTWRLEASHIVGGEFQLVKNPRGNDFQLILRMYFDALNAGVYGPGDKPKTPVEMEGESINAYIYQKSDNFLMDVFELALNKNYTTVPYSVPECAKVNSQDVLKTYDVEFVNNSINLPSNRYNDPQGYYIVWERCCRNKTINNIETPDQVGQTFYLEFPPVIKNGKSFYNSSPFFNKIKGDYACIRETFTFEFGGVDFDKDSLVYSLVTPFVGSDDTGPSPYNYVTWKSGGGYDEKHQINGVNGPLKINSKTGQIMVSPDRVGLFVVGVLCEEYRKGVKIGVVRRDFQFKVIDCPDKNAAPVATLKVPNQPGFYKEGDTIKVAVEESKCFNISITDSNSATRTESITLQKLLDDDISYQDSIYISSVLTISATHGAVSSRQPVMNSSLCLNPCKTNSGPTTDTILNITVLVTDNGCPQPRSDTLNLKFLLLQDPSPILKLKFPNGNFYNEKDTIVMGVEDLRCFTLNVGDSSSLLAPENIFIKKLTGNLKVGVISIADTNGVIAKGTNSFETQMCLDPCKGITISKDSLLKIKIVATDDGCPRPKTDTLQVNLLLKANAKPHIALKIPGQSGFYNELDTITVQLEEQKCFALNLWDSTSFTSPEKLFINTLNGRLPSDVFSFTFTEGTLNTGIDTLKPNLCIAPCEKIFLEKDSLFIADILVRDDGCPFPKTDTLQLKIFINVPTKIRPQVKLRTGILNYNVIVARPLSVIIDAKDPERINVSLSAEGVGFNMNEYGMSFKDTAGTDSISSTLHWQPDCKALQKKTFMVNFIAKKRRSCVNSSDTTSITINVEDTITDLPNIIPANLITPNKEDTLNSYFSIEKLPSGLPLPLDNCDYFFTNVSIYNRWGAKVFEASSRDFRWYPSGFPDGLYYYLIDLNKKKIKGWLEIIR